MAETSLLIDKNYPTKVQGNDFQWINGKLVDTNNMNDPYVYNSLLKSSAATEGTGGLAVSDYLKVADNSPYRQFLQSDNIQGIGGKDDLSSYDFSGVTDTNKTPPGGTEQSWTDVVKGWFEPTGEKGTSVGGNIMGAVGTGVNALSGLAGMYYAKKNFDLKKDQANYLKNREAKFDAAKERLATNIGNGASYLVDRGQ